MPFLFLSNTTILVTVLIISLPSIMYLTVSIWFSLTICSLSNYVILLIITSVAPYGPQDRIKISSSAFKVLNGLASYAYLSNFSWSFPCMLPIHTQLFAILQTYHAILMSSFISTRLPLLHNGLPLPVYLLGEFLIC